MTIIQIRAAKKKGDKTVPTLSFNFGVTLPNSIAVFGATTVHELFVSAARQQLTEWARKLLKRKKNPLSITDLQDALDCGEFVPGLKKRGKSALDKAAALIDSMTPEERLKLAEIARKFAPGGEFAKPEVDK